MLILVAPLVDQLNVLLLPEVMLVGLAVNELIVGLVGAGLTVTVTVLVAEPALSVAVSVYVVVAVGDTLVEPLADVEVNEPGVMLMLVAPLVDQLNVLLLPEVIVVGLAANELIVGFVGAGLTVTVSVLVVEPALFVAVNVYVVVAVGDTLVEPLADVEVNEPGVMLMLVAPLVDQLNVLLLPEVIVVGLAVNELIVGFVGAGLTVTVTVLVAEPALSVAVSVYVVVAVGDTLVVPLEDVEVNEPGVMPMLVAPFVAQLKVVLPPAVIVPGLSVNDVIVGFDAAGFTVTVAELLVEPELFLAVNV
jgi:hypothetical protein